MHEIRTRRADGRKTKSWRTAAPAFSRREAETWGEAVRRDAKQIVANHGELPAIDRYALRIHPARHPEAACLAVLAAFERAPAWTDVLAEAWRARFPAWSDAIDAAVGVSSLDTGPHAIEAVGRRIGPVAPDGLGRYELLERIGEGSSGVVFRAVDHVFLACGEPGEVAVKLIPRAAADVEAGLREAGVARRISHGGVARVLDAGRIESSVARELGCGEVAIFIVHEFIHGQPLWVWKACHPERAAEACGAIVAGIREAIDACHASGVIHGDLNPANILIEESGRTRIIDFGRSVPGLGFGRAKTRQHDHEGLEAIRGWLLRDLRRARTGSRGVRVGVAAAALAGLGTLAALFLPEPSRMDSHAVARGATATLPVPDASVGGYQLFKQDGRVVLIPRSVPEAGERPPGNGGEGKTAPTIESIQILDPGMMTIRIPQEKFGDMFGEPTGEVTPEGLAVYRVAKDRLDDQIAASGHEPMVLVPQHTAAVPASAAKAGEPSPDVARRDAAISELFGDLASEPGHDWKLALAGALLQDGPVATEDRAERLSIADRLKHEADAQRRLGRARPGLELLASLAFLSADENAEALHLALQATRLSMPHEQRGLAAIIEAIAGSRMETYFGGVGPADVEDFARRHSAPGLMRFSFYP